MPRATPAWSDLQYGGPHGALPVQTQEHLIQQAGQQSKVPQRLPCLDHSCRRGRLRIRRCRQEPHFASVHSVGVNCHAVLAGRLRQAFQVRAPIRWVGKYRQPLLRALDRQVELAWDRQAGEAGHRERVSRTDAGR